MGIKLKGFESRQREVLDKRNIKFVIDYVVWDIIRSLSDVTEYYRLEEFNLFWSTHLNSLDRFNYTVVNC